jgi:hypothetical protein
MPAPANDDIANAVEIAGFPFTYSGTTSEATAQVGEPDSRWIDGVNRSVWFVYNPDVAGTVYFNTSGSDLDTTLTVYSSSGAADFGELLKVVDNDDSQFGFASEVTFAADPALTYYFQLDGHFGGAGDYTFSYGSFDPAWNPDPARVRNDFDGDGKADILWRGQDGKVALWTMDAAEIADASEIDANPGTEWTIAGTGDFGGDGKADILWRHQDGRVAAWTMDGILIADAGEIAANPGTEWTIAGTGDFGGDGKADILWRHQDGQVAVWTMDGAEITAAGEVDADPGTEWTIAGTDDFNGDGKADILWRHQDGQVATWTMDGAAITNAVELAAAPDGQWQIFG